MNPSQEQFEAYKSFMSKMPVIQKPFWFKPFMFFLIFSLSLPMLLFVGQNFIEINKVQAYNWIFGFSSVTFVFFLLITFVSSIILLLLLNNSQRWLTVYEKNFKGVVSRKDEIIMKKFSLTKVAFILASTFCMFYFGVHFLSGAILALYFISQYMIKKSVFSEVAIVGEAILKNRFNPPKIGLIKK